MLEFKRLLDLFGGMIWRWKHESMCHLWQNATNGNEGKSLPYPHQEGLETQLAAGKDIS